ncbi:hypothetical protein ACJA88_002480 [Fusarium oxysporum]
MNIEERKLMQKAQKAGQFTDFAFLCKGKKIPVHKIIIFAQSKVFNAACTSDFKEARSGVYDLSEYPLELVEMMVDYFYVGHYDNPIRVASKLSLSMHSSMLALADKKATKRLIDQISDASQDFLKEVMMSIMSTPLESRCGDCNQRTRSLKISQEIRYFSPYPTYRQYNPYQNGLAGL